MKIIRKALDRGFRVTVNCTLFQGESAEEVADFMNDMMELGVEGVTISPGYSYERAPRQDGEEALDMLRDAASGNKPGSQYDLVLLDNLILISSCLIGLNK